MLHRYRLVAQLLLIALLSGSMPQAARSAPPPVSAGTAHAPSTASVALPPPSAPAQQLVPSVIQPQLPGLTLNVGLALDPIAVGETTTISITVINRSPYPADNLVVTAPTPDGAVANPGPNTVSPSGGWRWTVARLDGRQRLTVNGDLRLVRVPVGDALALKAQATASGLQDPISTTGGALVVDRTLGPATVTFTPGSAAVLHSRNGRVTVQVPPRAASRRLTIRHGDTPLGDSVPSDLAGLRRGLGVFFLDATDDSGAAVHQFTQPLTITVGYSPEQLAARGIAEANLTLAWFDFTARRWQPVVTQVDPNEPHGVRTARSLHTASAHG